MAADGTQIENLDGKADKKVAAGSSGQSAQNDFRQLSANEVALALRIPANRLTEIISGKRSISADTAMRLGRYLGTSSQMWMNLQSHYDLEVAEAALAERIDSEVQPYRKTA